MSKKITVLLSGGGGAGTIEIIRKLQSYGKYRVVTVDADEYAVGLYLADYGEKVPFVTSKKYFSVLEEIIKKQKVDIFIPLIDEELVPSYTFVRKFKKVKLILPQIDFTKLVLNKYKMVKAFQKKNISCPTTYLYDEINRKTFEKKMFIKPIIGRGSRGAAIIQSKKELNEYFKNQPFTPEQILLQDYIGGVEYTISAVVGVKGKIHAIVPKRILKKKGITNLSITENNPEINRVVEDIQKKFQANGPFNVQLKMYKGKSYILEVNPRFSTTVAHTIAAGIDEVHCLIQDFMGKEALNTRRMSFENKLIMMRYVTQKYISESSLK